MPKKTSEPTRKKRKYIRKIIKIGPSFEERVGKSFIWTILRVVEVHLYIIVCSFWIFLLFKWFEPVVMRLLTDAFSEVLIPVIQNVLQRGIPIS